MTLKLIGRDEELGRLSGLVDRAASGSGSLVLIGGEAGAGKTALARTALDSSGMDRIEVAAAETPGREYAAITALLRAAIRKGYPMSRRDAALGVLLPELEGESGGRGSDQQAIHESIARALAEISSRQPLGVLVDDCHWADVATLDALAFLADVVSDMRLLVILTYRNDDIPRGHPLRRLRSDLRRKGRLLEVAVESLGADDTAALLETSLSGKPSPALTLQVFQRTEGLPFFIQEVAAALSESGSLRPSMKGLDLDPDAAFPLPESVRDAVLQRVDKLSDAQRDALTAAAVTGIEFNLSATTDDLINALPVTGLVVDQGNGRFAFRHSLVRDTLYETIPWARRQSLHRAEAKRLEAASAPPHAIATHSLAAGDSNAAREWLVKAGRSSFELCAYRDAASQLSRALDIWPADADVDRRLDALELLARCSELGGLMALAARAFTEVIELLESTEDRARYADAQRRLAASLEVQGAWDRAVTARQLAAAAFVEAGRPDEAAIERLTVAAKLRSAASFTAALELIEVGKSEARLAARKDIELRLCALEGNVMARAGNSEAGVRIVRMALADALAGADFGTAAEAYQRLADSLEHAGDYRAAQKVYVEAADFCRTNGAASMGEVCLACLTMVLRQSGDWDHAADVCKEVIASPASNAHAQAVAHGVLGSVMLQRGRLKQARSELHNSNVLARRIGLAAMEIDSETHLARLAAVSDRMDEARERCRRVIKRWRRTDAERHYSISNLRWIASFAGQVADIDLLRDATAALTTIAAKPSEEAHAAATSALAEGSMAEGDPSSAAARFEQAIAILSGVELPFDSAEVECRAAAAYAAAGNRHSAVEKFRSAHRAAIKLGARPLANRIAEQVTALGEKVERRLGRLAAAGVGRGGLSPRELEVTRLVASGLTSREVASRLSLSPRTVEMHVHRILGKLDCRTRVDITRRAAELGLLQTAAETVSAYQQAEMDRNHRKNDRDLHD
jgi:ATP/maltotriose-dependent transcriptional regulator MalT